MKIHSTSRSHTAFLATKLGERELKDSSLQTMTKFFLHFLIRWEAEAQSTKLYFVLLPLFCATVETSTRFVSYEQK